MTESAVADATIASIAKPAIKPARPHFSSGPCAKPPGWDASKLAVEVLGRSHRSKLGKARLQYAIDLMRELQETFGTAIVLITHDMGVVAENADRVVVMYAGRKVEEAPADVLFNAPGHPYTVGLLGSIPHLDQAARSGARRTRLNEIKGMVPSLFNLPAGCSFAPRCGLATERCRVEAPPLEEHRPGHFIACWHAA